MDALQYARYKQPVSGLPITKLIDPSDEQNLKKINSTSSSHIDCLPSPPPSPEVHRRKAVSGKPGDLKFCCLVPGLLVLSPLIRTFVLRYWFQKVVENTAQGSESNSIEETKSEQ